MKNVILPTDFSDNARNAIDYAMNLFRGEKCRFILTNAYRVPQAGASMLVSIEDIMAKEAAESLTQLRQSLILKYGDSDDYVFEQQAIYGDVIDAIRKLVPSVHADMVVMGTKGASGLKEVVVGSNTASAIRNAECPVLAVPENATFRPPVTIAFATDYGEINSSAVLAPVLHLAGKYKAKLLIFNVQPEGVLVDADKAAEGLFLHRSLESVKHEFLQVEGSSRAKGIETFVQGKKPDILVMVRREHDLIERLFSRSVTRSTVMHTEVPLLVLHDE